MAVIVENRQVEGNIYLMRFKGAELGVCGQFYMLKVNNTLDPLLARPISIFDIDEHEGTASVLYQVVGRGTELMASAHVGDSIMVSGPYGNGFSLPDSDITLIGGGIGIAPLHYLAKCHKRLYPSRNIACCLGFRNESMLSRLFANVCDEVRVNVGGYVTDDVDFSDSSRVYYACGPTPMMRAAKQKAQEHEATLYLSLESHMGCGVGACLICSCKTTLGNKRVCKDGPVFLSSEVIL